MKNLLIVFLVLCTLGAKAQTNLGRDNEQAVMHKYRVSLPVIISPQLLEKVWDDRTHTQHIELHVKGNLDDKNIIFLFPIYPSLPGISLSDGTRLHVETFGDSTMPVLIALHGER